MKVTVVADALLYKTKKGEYWCKSIYGYEFWERYLSSFSSVEIVSRTKNVSEDEVAEMLRVDGPNVSVKTLPYSRGMKAYLMNYIRIKHAVKKAAKSTDCAIIRLPSIIADMYLKEYKKQGKPYFLEIVADPYDAYAFNKLAKNYFSYRLSKSIKEADGVSYVTKKYLQSKYPPNSSQITTHYSTIDLKTEHFGSPKKYPTKNKEFNFIHVANSMNNDIKGHDIALEVLNYVLKKGYNCKLTFIGDGPYRKKLEELSLKYGIDEHINFVGMLSNSELIRSELKKADLFLFPTKAEGLPRALIEAMAIGLPALSTPVNGVPELLSSDYLFDPLDVNSFGNKVIYLLNNPKDLEKMSENNIKKAYEYRYDILQDKRDIYYKKLLVYAEQKK